MPGLLDMPIELIQNHLLPLLTHNEILRFRRVSKTTNKMVSDYIWTSKSGNQGQWVLDIDENIPGHTLEDFVRSDSFPASFVNIKFNSDPTSINSFFENPNINTFVNVYSKYVTRLFISVLRVPCSSINEFRFFESLVNLRDLWCLNLQTISAKQTDTSKCCEENNGIPTNFGKLKSFHFGNTDCSDSTLKFIKGLESLEDIMHYPIDANKADSNARTVVFDKMLIQQNFKLKTFKWNCYYRLMGGPYLSDINPSEFISFFTLCAHRGIRIQNISADFFDLILLCDNNGILDESEHMDDETQELVYSVNYQKHLQIGDVIESLNDLTKTVFLLELPNLKKILITNTMSYSFRIWKRHGYPKWTELRNLDVTVKDNSIELLQFLCELMERPNLEEFALRYSPYRNEILPLPCPFKMALSFKNLKKLTIEGCTANYSFFVPLWSGLNLLEDIKLKNCTKLGNQGFIGNTNHTGPPIFLKLTKLKHLHIEGVENMPWLTDSIFRKVFRHIRLASFKLCGKTLFKRPRVTSKGIYALLTGAFAEFIEDFDFEELELKDITPDEKKTIASLFRSSKMR